MNIEPEVIACTVNVSDFNYNFLIGINCIKIFGLAQNGKL